MINRFAPFLPCGISGERAGLCGVCKHEARAAMHRRSSKRIFPE